MREEPFKRSKASAPSGSALGGITGFDAGEGAATRGARSVGKNPLPICIAATANKIPIKKMPVISQRSCMSNPRVMGEEKSPPDSVSPNNYGEKRASHQGHPVNYSLKMSDFLQNSVRK